MPHTNLAEVTHKENKENQVITRKTKNTQFEKFTKIKVLKNRIMQLLLWPAVIAKVCLLYKDRFLPCLFIDWNTVSVIMEPLIVWPIPWMNDI